MLFQWCWFIFIFHLFSLFFEFLVGISNNLFKILKFVQGNHGIQCPKPIKTKNGKLFEKYSLNSGDHIVRLLKYIDGTILMKVPHCSSLLYQIGETTARMNNVMKVYFINKYNLGTNIIYLFNCRVLNTQLMTVTILFGCWNQFLT